MMREKIHCIESQKEGFDDMPLKEVREMIGYYIYDHKSNKWTVTLIDKGDFFDAKDQDSAEIIASNEMIKAMLMKK